MGYRRDAERRLFTRCNTSSLTISCSLALRVSVSAAPSGTSNNPTWAAILRVARAAFSLPFSALSTCFSTIPSSLLIERFRAPSRRTTGAVSAPWMMVLRFRLFRGRPRGFPGLAGLDAGGDRWAGVATRPAGGAAAGAGRGHSIGQPLPTVVRGLTPASGAAGSSHLSHLSVPEFGSPGHRIRHRCGRGLL